MKNHFTKLDEATSFDSQPPNSFLKNYFIESAEDHFSPPKTNIRMSRKLALKSLPNAPNWFLIIQIAQAGWERGGALTPTSKVYQNDSASRPLQIGPSAGATLDEDQRKKGKRHELQLVHGCCRIPPFNKSGDSQFSSADSSRTKRKKKSEERKGKETDEPWPNNHHRSIRRCPVCPCSSFLSATRAPRLVCWQQRFIHIQHSSHLWRGK